MADTETLKLKGQRLTELANLIKFHAGNFMGITKQAEIEALHARMEFRLKELVEESKLKEIEIKIGIYEQVVDVMKRK